MKKLLWLAALTVSAQALAEIKLTTRIDYTLTGKYDDAQDLGNTAGQTQLFSAPFNRIQASGKAGDADVKTSLNLWGSSITGTAGAYSLYSFVDYLYIQKPFTEQCYVKLGRLQNPGGGFEYDETNKGDQYRSTVANGGATSGGITTPLAPGIGALVVTHPTVFSNPGGLAAGYKFNDDHQLELHITNESNVPAGTGVRKEQNKGLHYHGAFADKMVELKAGYIDGRADTLAGTVRTPIKQKFLNVGVKLNVNNIGLTVEHFGIQQKTEAATEQTDKVSTIYAQLDYKVDKFRPLVKYETSEVEINESADSLGSFKRTAMTVGLEFTPKENEELRWHASWSQMEDKLGAPIGTPAAYTNNKLETSQFIAGIKFSADFLK